MIKLNEGPDVVCQEESKQSCVEMVPKFVGIEHLVLFFQNQEALLKKKLQSFLAEMLRMGTVKGFKYFAMYMRGREEMVLSVLNQPLVSYT